MGICVKIFIINLCLTPCTDMKASNGRLSNDGSGQARRHGVAFGGSYPQIFFVPSQILLCSEKLVLNI